MLPPTVPFKIIQVKRYSVFCYGSAKDRDICRACCRCLESRGGVGQDQIHIVGDTKSLMMVEQVLESPLGVLLVKSHFVAERFCKRVLEALCRPYPAASCCTSWQMPTVNVSSAA